MGQFQFEIIAQMNWATICTGQMLNAAQLKYIHLILNTVLWCNISWEPRRRLRWL